jgi:hypothetical protein
LIEAIDNQNFRVLQLTHRSGGIGALVDQETGRAVVLAPSLKRSDNKRLTATVSPFHQDAARSIGRPKRTQRTDKTPNAVARTSDRYR